ncbi:hypothetical protein Tco_0083652 [Tanacetum coccineum]
MKKQAGRKREPNYSCYASNRGGNRGSRGCRGHPIGGRGEPSGGIGDLSGGIGEPSGGMGQASAERYQASGGRGTKEGRGDRSGRDRRKGGRCILTMVRNKGSRGCRWHPIGGIGDLSGGIGDLSGGIGEPEVGGDWVSSSAKRYQQVWMNGTETAAKAMQEEFNKEAVRLTLEEEIIEKEYQDRLREEE